jgi:hypothetical protein
MRLLLDTHILLALIERRMAALPSGVHLSVVGVDLFVRLVSIHP